MQFDPTQAGTPPGSGGGGDAEALVGRVLAGRYKLSALLGQGGMGAVYAAEDELLGRGVAVKVIRAALASDQKLVARFQREARAAAALAHTTLVTVHDTGVDGGLPYLVMERLSGESLAQRLRRQPMPAERVVEIVSRVLDGLGAAHQAGIVHRDIKPDNVFLCAPDESPKILDFGIAAAHKHDPEAQRLTDPGAGVGTPMYVAPEQLTGSEPDPRADVYSVGAMLYEALSGKPLFEARTLPELYAKKLHETPPPLERIAPQLPAPLTAVVDKAIEKNPDARFASAAALKSALLEATTQLDAKIPATRVGRSAPQPTPLDGEIAPAGKIETPRRKRWKRVALALEIAAVIIYAGHAWRSTKHEAGTRPPPQPALREPTLGLRQLAQLHDASGSRRNLLTDADAWKAAAQDLAQAAGQPNAPARWRAGALLARGEAALIEMSLDEAVQALEQAIAADPSWASPHVALGKALFQKGQLEPSLAELRKAEAIEPTWWLPVATAGTFYSNANRHPEALQAFRRALALAPDEPKVLDDIAIELHASRMDQEALEYARRALAKDAELPLAHVLLADHALEGNDGVTALQEASTATMASPNTASAQLARADALALLGRKAEALLAYQQFLDVARGSENGLPSGRLKLVAGAIKKGKLPPPRVAGGKLAERSRPASKAPAPDRSKPPVRSKPGVIDSFE